MQTDPTLDSAADPTPEETPGLEGKRASWVCKRAQSKGSLIQVSDLSHSRCS